MSNIPTAESTDWNKDDSSSNAAIRIVIKIYAIEIVGGLIIGLSFVASPIFGAIMLLVGGLILPYVYTQSVLAETERMIDERLS